MAKKPIKPTLENRVPPLSGATRLVAAVQPTMPDPSGTSFRPVLRPPMAIAELLDDGVESGERFRLRLERTVFGRADCEITIPHDPQISSSHAAIERTRVDGEWHWLLKDLNSTNGTFLRVARCSLGGSNTVLIGAHRYKYRAAGGATPQADDQPVGTQGWKVPTAEELQSATASLVRIFPDGTEKALSVNDGEVRIGSDSSRCQLVIDDDPMIDSVHAVLKISNGKPIIEDSKSKNGIWACVRERRLAPTSTFQIGEQRVRFRIPS